MAYIRKTKKSRKGRGPGNLGKDGRTRSAVSALDIHKKLCKICNRPDCNVIEAMYLDWHSPEEIAAHVSGLVSSNGDNGSRHTNLLCYKDLQQFNLALKRHVAVTGLIKVQLENWRGARRQIIKVGMSGIKGLPVAHQANLTMQALSQETDQATAAVRNAQQGTNIFLGAGSAEPRAIGNVPTAQLQTIIVTAAKQITSGGQTEPKQDDPDALPAQDGDTDDEN